MKVDEIYFKFCRQFCCITDPSITIKSVKGALEKCTRGTTQSTSVNPKH